ncbi:paraquat-inducible protein A [Labrenzia sp. PHM005]|uniref:paraquat-inducible protein A n=1 Tax=Labrenzia sp. PHM005 TaxID=2590016 RepID=UPI0011403F54|nr:paraquat-inducible protein A [Labrenzia sp. PHM005]QDG75776.1 paraquat-inducible protein A [Labrenzia sp. PHM005]
MRLVIAFLLPIATFSFALGITLPMMRLEKLYFLEERPSLIDVIQGLWVEGDAALAVVIALFSVIFPAAKIALTHVAAVTGGRSRSLALLSAVSKWSMLDVMLVALVLFAAKTSGLAAASLLPGLWFYAGATLATALAAMLCQRA